MELGHEPCLELNKAVGPIQNTCHLNMPSLSANDLWAKAPDIIHAYLWLLGNLMEKGDSFSQVWLFFGAVSDLDSMTSSCNLWTLTILAFTLNEYCSFLDSHFLGSHRALPICQKKRNSQFLRLWIQTIHVTQVLYFIRDHELVTELKICALASDILWISCCFTVPPCLFNRLTHLNSQFTWGPMYPVTSSRYFVSEFICWLLFSWVTGVS